MITKEERILLRNDLFDLFNRLNIILCNKTNTVQLLRKKLNEELQINQMLFRKYNLYVSQFRSEEEAIYCLTHHDDNTNHICPICNKICGFINNKRKKQYQKTCGDKKCITATNSSEEAIMKSKQTKLKRYGNSNYNNNIKASQTCLERYGTNHPSKVKEVKDKIKQTWINNYGVDHPMKTKEVQDKMKRTNRIKYGCDCSLQNEEVNNKARKTCLDKYNVEYPAQNIDIYNKVKQTNRIKYGYDCSLENNEVKAKSKKTMLERYGTESNVQVNIEHYDIWNNDNKFKQFIDNKYNEKGSFLVLNDIACYFNTVSRAVKRKIESLNLLDYFYIQQSHLEAQFKCFLEKNNIIYKIHDRSILYNKEANQHKEIDFLCNSIGFEINDITTHNSIHIHTYKDKQYHINKSIEAREKGVHLIHLWEWEMRNEDEWDKLSKWILNLLNDNKIKIGARKCTIKEVLLKEEKVFLNNYHLQGYKKSEICLGLYYENELIMLESFCKPRYNKNYQYELLRLCTKYGYSIIGGAKRLLDHFIKNYQPESIISYCNLDKFTGKVYEDIGFKLLKNTGPQLIWCNKDMKHFTQSSLTWIGADKMIGTNYGKGTDNKEIVQKHGYVPIYNCGLAIYTFNIAKH